MTSFEEKTPIYTIGSILRKSSLRGYDSSSSTPRRARRTETSDVNSTEKAYVRGDVPTRSTNVKLNNLSIPVSGRISKSRSNTGIQNRSSHLHHQVSFSSYTHTTFLLIKPSREGFPERLGSRFSRGRRKG